MALCSPLSLNAFGSSNDDLLFGGMDLDDLFADDLMGALLGEPSVDLGCGLLPPTTSSVVPSDTAFLLPALQPAVQPTSSTDSHGGACTTSSSRSTNSDSIGGLFQGSATVMQLPVQRSAGPPTRRAAKRGAVRQLQQGPADQPVMMAATPAASKAALAPPPAALHSVPVSFQHDELLALLRSGGESSDDEDSDNSSDSEALQDGCSKKSNKRKAPEVDWRSITDPSERRRQRRLAKNRMTAARSRERKKVQWADMEAKLARMNNDNKRLKAMLQQLANENSALRGQLEGMVRGKQVPGRLVGHSHSTEPAVLVFISILLLLCCALPGDQAMLLGSAAPMLLLAQQLLSQPSSCEPSRPPLALALLRFLATIKLLLSRASARLRGSVHRMLFRRHHHVGRRVLADTATWAAKSNSRLLGGGGPLIHVKQEPDDVLLSVVKQEPFEASAVFDAGSFLISGLLS